VLAASGYAVPAAGFSLADGALPPGLSLSAAGELAGTPVSTGSYTFLVEGEDLNGFAAARSYTLEILPGDHTAPTITPVVTGSIGDDDWYTSDIAIGWTVLDAESGITSSSGCTPQSVTTDTAGTTFECTATSAGGTATATVTVKRDATPPVLNPAVVPGTVVVNGTATASAQASDNLSGIAGQSCATPATTVPGTHEVACHAVDNAGNASSGVATYTVVYGFAGFFAPIENPGVMNVATAGRTLPFKWRLVDAGGSPVTTLANVTVRTTTIACDGSAVSDAIEDYATSNTGLLDLGGGEYQYNWQSPKSFENSCRKVTVDLGDGATHFALFRFR
jgi:hypothetical protein